MSRLSVSAVALVVIVTVALAQEIKDASTNSRQDATNIAPVGAGPVALPPILLKVDRGNVRSIPEDVRAQDIRTVRNGRGAPAIGPSIVYENDIVPMDFLPPGANVLLMDDLLLIDNPVGRDLVEISGVLVFSNGASSYNVSFDLWTDDGTGQGPVASIPGTMVSFGPLTPGTIFELQASYNPGIKLPPRVWLCLIFSDNSAGWIIANQAEIGFTDDFYWVDPPGSLFCIGNAACGDTGLYSGFCGRIIAKKQSGCQTDADCGKCEVCDTQTNTCVDVGPPCCTSDAECGDFATKCRPGLCDLASNTCFTGDKSPGCCESDGQCTSSLCRQGLCDPINNTCGLGPKAPGCCETDSQCGKCELCDTGEAQCVRISPDCCTTNAECDDGVPCTTDLCDAESNVCIHQPGPDCDKFGDCCLDNGQCVRDILVVECKPPFGFPVDDCPEDDICIPPSDDCWNTPCGDTQYSFANNPIPAGFFGLSSSPFDGIVKLGGASGGPDTIIRRLEAAAPAVAKGTFTIAIELVALSLRSCFPITVKTPSGPVEWDVEVTLSEQPVGLGEMGITKTHVNGGYFRASFQVQPTFTFTRVDDPADVRILDLSVIGKPPALLETIGTTPWVHQDTQGNVVPKCNTASVNFLAGVSQNPLTLNITCVPTGHAGPGHLHVTGRICTPKPEGACCNTANGSCTLAMGEDDCKGVYKGDGTDCRDNDGDGLADWFETNDCNDFNRNVCSTGTDPNNPDTDGDGLADGFEIKKTKCDPCVPDSVDLNGDGIPDACAAQHFIKFSQRPKASLGVCTSNPFIACNADSDCQLCIGGPNDGAACTTNADCSGASCEAGFCLPVPGTKPGEDYPSDLDWADGDPNKVAADDFVSDGRPITAVRWWGSNIPKGDGGEIKPVEPIQPGVDLWTTLSGPDTYQDFNPLADPIPADFFNLGSDPFTSIVFFEGVPLGASPSLGATDTIVERLDEAVLSDCPDSQAIIPIEIVALSLRSVNPITVTYNGGQSPEQWDIRVVLSNAPQQQGQMTIRPRCAGGGTYDSTLPVLSRLTFTCLSPACAGKVRVFDAGLEGLPPNVFETSGTFVNQADPVFGVPLAPSGTQIDTNGDGLFDLVLAVGSSNFVPGLEEKDCIDCKAPSNGQNKSGPTREQAMWAAHGVATPQSPAERACCTGSACSIGTRSDCDALGGHFVEGSVTCISNPCDIGSCCIGAGECEDEAFPGVPCDPFVPETCMDEVLCGLLGGTYVGGSSCADAACPQETLCCIPFEACFTKDAQVCDAIGGFTVTDCAECPVGGSALAGEATRGEDVRGVTIETDDLVAVVPPLSPEEHRAMIDSATGQSGTPFYGDLPAKGDEGIGTIAGLEQGLGACPITHPGGGVNEPDIEVNPQDDQNIVAASLFCLQVSTDGGVTWSAPTIAPRPPALPAGNFGWAGDPSLAFDSLGRLFWTYLLTDPTNGLLDIYIVRVDPTTGLTVGGPVSVTGAVGLGAAAGNNHDKQWLAADSWPKSPFQDRLYVVWTDFTVPTQIRAAYSTNQGATWTLSTDGAAAPSTILSVPAEGFVWPSHNTVAPNGDVYLTYHSQPGFAGNAPDGISGQVLVLRSTDGGMTYPQKTTAYAGGLADVTFNVQTAARTIPQTTFWLQGSAQPWVLADPHHLGRIYVVANDDPGNPLAGDPADVFIAISTDNGLTWGAPARIDDVPGTNFSVMPTAAIDRYTGCIAVHYYTKEL